MTPILPVAIQVLSLAVLLALSAWVTWLIRNQRLQLREAMLWLVTTIAAMVVTAFPRLLVWGATLLGVAVPANALFGAALLYLAVNVLAVTISVSSNTSRVRRLAQECALLRAELDELRRAAGRGRSPEQPPQYAPDQAHREP
jgi:hypothetical protein